MSRRLLRTHCAGWALAAALMLSLGCADRHASNTVGVTRNEPVVPPLTDETSNPDLRRDGVDATENIIFRCHRYAPDDPRLAGLDLTPKGTIELPPAP